MAGEQTQYDRHPSVRFLRGLFPDPAAKVQLVRIRKGAGGGINATTLNPHTEAPAVVKWIEEKNGSTARWDYYFALNEVSTPDKKGEKGEITRIRGFAVDQDCGEAREALNAAQKLFFEGRPGGVPEPTAVVYSGGGHWAFWMLAEPVEVSGDTGLLDNVDDVLGRLCDLLDGDPASAEVARICRLPGTVNYASDRKAHRTDQKATVLHDDWTARQTPRRYSLANFMKLPGAPRKRKAQERERLSAGLAKPEGDARSCGPSAATWAWTDLGYDVDSGGMPKEADKLSAVIVQGPQGAVGIADENHADLIAWKKPDGSWDRSQAVFWVCCEMDRRGVPPEIRAAVIQDRSNGISDHLWDHAPGDGLSPTFKRELYARRQVERAMADNDEKHLEMLNAYDPPFKWEDARGWLALRYATIDNYGGKYRVMSRPGVDGDDLPSFLEKDQWKRRFDGFATEKIDPETGEVKLIGVADAFLNDRHRPRFRTVVFQPGADAGERDYNLFTGLNLRNKPTSCERYLDLMFEVIADRKQEVMDYLLNWMALPIQKLGEKLHVAVAMKGGYGTGKSVFAECYGGLYGSHFVPVSGNHTIAHNFNSLLHRALFVFGDEMDAAHSRSIANRLKTVVTQAQLEIEYKGVDKIIAANRFNMMVAANDTHMLRIDPGDRRWLVLEVSDRRKQQVEFFAALKEEWQTGGREAFHQVLMERDLSGFVHQRRPITAAHTGQVLESLEGAELIVFKMLARAETPPVRKDNGEVIQTLSERRGLGGRWVFVPTASLIEWAASKRILTRDAATLETSLGRLLAKIGGGEATIRRQVGGRQRSGAWLPPPPEARRIFERELGRDLAWEAAIDRWDIDPATGETDPEVPF